MNAGEVNGRPMGSGRGQLSGLKVVLAILVAQLELGKAQLLQELLIPLQGLLFLEVVGAAVARALVDRGVRALFPAVEGTVAVGTPVRSLGRTLAASELRPAATDFTTQLAGLATIVEVEERRGCAAVGATAGGRQRAGTATSPNRSQRLTVVSLILSTQLPPVQGGGGRGQRRRLGQGDLGIDVEIAIVRMLLAKVVAGLRLGLMPGENLLQFVDKLLQVLASKFPAEPKHQAWYLAHGGESLGNLAGSLHGFGKERLHRLLLLQSSPNLQPGSAYKIQGRSPEAGGESPNPSFPPPIQPIIGLRKRSC